MPPLPEIIAAITKYGLRKGLASEDAEADLERNLVYLYAHYFASAERARPEEGISATYVAPDRKTVRANVERNFPDFGFYHATAHPRGILDDPQLVVGDATDDATDVIIGLLEVEWRLRQGGEAEALYDFRFDFESHLRPHVLGLLTFLASEEE